MIDEGYIKYRIDWQRSAPLPQARVAELDAWRRRLHAAGLVGHDARHDVGYGNVSVRDPEGGGFIITGTQTGHIEATGPAHYAQVTGFDLEGNRVSCRGPVKASSEALTHAALYTLDPAIGAVVHVHCQRAWQALIDRLPTTSCEVPYGTPAMAREFARLYRDSGFADDGVAVMAGHADGLVAIGATLEQAARRLLDRPECQSVA